MVRKRQVCIAREHEMKEVLIRKRRILFEREVWKLDCAQHLRLPENMIERLEVSKGLEHQKNVQNCCGPGTHCGIPLNMQNCGWPGAHSGRPFEHVELWLAWHPLWQARRVCTTIMAGMNCGFWDKSTRWVRAGLRLKMWTIEHRQQNTKQPTKHKLIKHSQPRQQGKTNLQHG